jgi:hypothetical protein
MFILPLIKQEMGRAWAMERASESRRRKEIDATIRKEQLKEKRRSIRKKPKGYGWLEL